MTSPTRARLSAVGASAVIVACVAALTFYFWQIHSLLFEAYALTALFVAFRAVRPVRSWLAGLPLAHRAILYSLLGAIVVGHFTSNKRSYYPFVAWDIFSAVSNQDTVTCRELIGTTAGGQSVRLLVEQLFPSIIQFDLPPENEAAQTAHLAAVLAEAYNARHAADPVREVDLMLVTVKLHPPPGSSSSPPSCLQRHAISSAPSS